MTVTPPDWRNENTYNYTAKLSRAGWAWEFLRRNPKFQSDYARVMAKAPKVRRRTSRVSEMPELKRWGVVWCDPPSEDALSASVFWHADACTHVLPLVGSRRAGANVPESAFETLISRAQHLGSREGRHMLLCDGAHRLQLQFRGRRAGRSGLLLTPAVICPRLISTRLRLLSCFNDYLLAGKLLSKYFPLEPRERRLRVVLRALDGSLCSACHRDIAIALYGDERVRSTWNDPRAHLRDTVRRAVRRGKALMRSGYLRLLR